VIECLRKNQEALTGKCHSLVFKREVRLIIIIIIIIIIIHEFQSDASPEELQGRCSVAVFSLCLWPVTRTAERPDKQLSLQSAPKTVDSRQRRDRRWQ